MGRHSHYLLIPAVCLSTTAAVAAEVGFENALRLDVGLPVGNIDGGQSAAFPAPGDRALSDFAAQRVGVWADIGHRSQQTWWGMYGQVGLGTFGDGCPSGAECSWSELRLGLQGQWRWSTTSSYKPWLGAGIGYQWLRPTGTQKIDFVDDDGVTQVIAVKAREKLGGPELMLQGGADFPVDGALWVGPFASASVGTYLSDNYDCPEALACPGGSKLDDPALHAWLSIGVKASYGP